MLDQAIISGPRKHSIPEECVDLLRSSFPSRHRSERLDPEKGVVSICVDRKHLRAKILKDETFRRTFRALPLEVQDMYMRRGWLFWGKGGLGEPMTARLYVSDTKAFGNRRGNLLGSTLSNSLRGLQDRFESLANWAQGIIIVGTISAIVGTLGYLAVTARKILTDYSDTLAKAAESEAGLERAIRARSGHRGTGRGETSPALAKNADESTESASNSTPPEP